MSAHDLLHGRDYAHDLLSEGIAAEASGTLHCGYCEEAVGDVSCHLDLHYKKGKLHQRNHEMCIEALAQLRRRAWSLKYERVRLTKMMYHCELCGKREPWYKVWQDHVDTKAHAKARAVADLAVAPGHPVSSWTGA